MQTEEVKESHFPKLEWDNFGLGNFLESEFYDSEPDLERDTYYGTLPPNKKQRSQLGRPVPIRQIDYEERRHKPAPKPQPRQVHFEDFDEKHADPEPTQAVDYDEDLPDAPPLYSEPIGPDLKRPFNFFSPRKEQQAQMDWASFQAKKRQMGEARKEFREWKKKNIIRGRKFKYLDANNQVVDGYGRYRKRRRSYRYPVRRGRGGFFGNAWNAVKNAIPRGTFARIGGALGGAYGLGGLGSAAGNALSKWAGFGGYHARRTRYVKGRGAYNTSDGDQGSMYALTQQVPTINNTHGDDGAVRIVHREYIGDVVSTGSGFNMQYVLPIQPGNAGTFPWLSQIAGSFTQYQLEGMMFNFVSTSGALSTTQSLGEIIMAVNYNVSEADFTNKQQMLNEIMAVSKVPSEDAAVGVECDPQQTPMAHLLIREGAVPSGDNKKFYDIGTFYLATQGQAAAGTLGELWVTYQVAFYKPQMNVIGGGSVGSIAHYRFVTPTATAPLGSSAVALVDEIGLVLTSTQIVLPTNDSVGTQYMMYWCFAGSTPAAVTYPIVTLGSTLTNITPSPFYAATSPQSYTPTQGSTAGRVSICWPVKVTASPSASNTFTFGVAGTLPTGSESGELIVIKMDGNFK